MKTMTFLAALRHDRNEAPWLLGGPINGERFRIYIEEVLLPTLKPGDTPDNPPGSSQTALPAQILTAINAMSPK